MFLGQGLDENCDCLNNSNGVTTKLHPDLSLMDVINQMYKTNNLEMSVFEDGRYLDSLKISEIFTFLAIENEKDLITYKLFYTVGTFLALKSGLLKSHFEQSDYTPQT